MSAAANDETTGEGVNGLRICTTSSDLREERASLHGLVGFVATMGVLHDGHLALVRRARAEADHVVASIFVNPTQFTSSEESAHYPRTLDRDLAMLAAEGVDIVFTPHADELYPDGFATTIDVGPIADPLEGASRPGHFRGVATIVAKLLHITTPTHGYFGQKDAQQLLVIRRMVLDLNLPVDIVAVSTVREPDGLAMSSRNALLSPSERRAARCVVVALDMARERWDAGERRADILRDAMQSPIADEPLARLDYASVANPTTLAEYEGTIASDALASLAVHVGDVRLIDNLVLGRGDPKTATL